MVATVRSRRADSGRGLEFLGTMIVLKVSAAVLSEVDTKDRPCLLRSWDEVWVDLEDEVFASLLLLKDFKCLVRISRGNDTV
jgi:hypothetical protein